MFTAVQVLFNSTVQTTTYFWTSEIKGHESTFYHTWDNAQISLEFQQDFPAADGYKSKHCPSVGGSRIKRTQSHMLV